MALLESARSDASARERYDRLAPYYDRYVRWFERGHVERLLEDLEIVPGETVLDVGCGPGTALVRLGELVGPDGTVVGLDVSGRMIERARDRLERRGFGDRAVLVHGDARNARRIADDAVDAVVMTFTFELFSEADQERVLEECRRVLAPGGRLGVLSIGREDRLAVAVYERLRRLFPDVFDCRPIDLEGRLEADDFAVRSAWTDDLYGLPVTGVVAVDARE